jgi:5'-nucleotidase / UDP-sugar diphosphatase
MPMNMNRTKTLTLLAILLSISILALYASGLRENDKNFELTILHTNDIHAHDLPFIEKNRSIGGMARIGYLIKAIKGSHKNVIAIDAGDFFQGTPLFQLYQGEVEVNALNKADYDIATIGNHEFDNGPKNLAKQLQLARFSLISANLDCTKDPDLNRLVKPSVIKNIDGQQVAFIGVITPELEHVCLTLGAVKIKSPGAAWMEPIAQEVEKCKQSGINKIVLVSHCGVELDKQLAQSLPDVDVIIGGHSHTRLEEPIWVGHSGGNKTAIVQTGCYTRALGKLQLLFDSQGALVEPKCDYHLISITDRIKEDPSLAAYLEEKAKPLLKLREEIDGMATDEFDKQFNNMPWDSPIGDLICDALAEAGASYGVQIALQNRGGIRARIEKGTITEEKVQEILPFDNRLVLATLSGADLLNVLEHSLSGSLGGSFLDVHGLKIGYDPEKPKGTRIVFALTESKDKVWQPIEPHGQYKIAVNDYTFKGGEAYDFSKATNVIYCKDKLSQVLHQYLLKHKTVSPLPPNRIVAVNGSIASVQTSPMQRIAIHSPQPQEKIMVVVGSSEGVESLPKIIDRPLPLPLEGATIKGLKLFTDGSGHCSLDLSQIKRNAEDTYAAVICRPRQSKSSKQIQISYPLLLK